jgi:hypothetical protein
MKALRSLMAAMPSRATALGYSLPLLLALEGCAAAPTQIAATAAPRSDLVLDPAHPVIEATIAGVALRLRVDLSAHDTIELNPATAARLPIQYVGGPDVLVGRIRLLGRTAMAKVQIGSVERRLAVIEHGRECCVGVDGMIGPQSLPYHHILWRNPAAPVANRTIVLLLDDDPATGMSALVPREAARIRVRFALWQPESGATAAAGAILAAAWGGHWAAAEEQVVAAFGIRRPARLVMFDRPSTLAGFRFDRLMIRTADFGGHEQLPNDPVSADEIVVTQKVQRQEAWPAVTLGADRLSRCAEIAFNAEPRSLTLRCAFD